MAITSMKEQLLQSFKNFYTFLEGKCVSNLESTSNTLPLAASQGKALNDKITKNIDVSKNISEKLVPIGYIFTWTNKKVNGNTLNAPSLTTPDNVHNYFGFGEWERITDCFLYSGAMIGGTGGESSVVLKTANMPSHSHSIPSLNGYTNNDGSGAHTHKIQARYDYTAATKSGGAARANGGGSELSDDRFGVTTSAGAHTHTVTIYASTTETTGSDMAHNNMPPYVNVYMWMRVG